MLVAMKERQEQPNDCNLFNELQLSKYSQLETITVYIKLHPFSTLPTY